MIRQESRFQETLRAIKHQWPIFLSLYLGFVISLILIALSLMQQWFAFIPFLLALMIIIALHFMTRLWATYLLYDDNGLRPHHFLFDLGRIKENDTLVLIDHGYRRWGLDLARRLTVGKIIIVDIYNPQWMPSQMLVRQRRHRPTAVPDPRITWKDSQMGLLPLPDQSVSYVLVCQVVSELWQYGDQRTLFKEIYRILKPNGYLLLSERIFTKTNASLIDGIFFKSSHYWQRLIRESGFRLQREENLMDIIHCYRAVKPTPFEAKQMALELNYDS